MLRTIGFLLQQSKFLESGFEGILRLVGPHQGLDLELQGSLEQKVLPLRKRVTVS